MQRLSMFEQGHSPAAPEEEEEKKAPVARALPSYAQPPAPTPAATSYGYGEDAGATYGDDTEGAVYGDDQEGAVYGGEDGYGYGDDGATYDTYDADAGATYGDDTQGATYSYSSDDSTAQAGEDYGPSYPIHDTPTPPTPGYLQGVTHASSTPLPTPPIAVAPSTTKKAPPPVPPPKPSELQEPVAVHAPAPVVPLSVRQADAIPHPPPRSPPRTAVRSQRTTGPALPWREEDEPAAPTAPPRSPRGGRSSVPGPALPFREALAEETTPMPLPVSPGRSATSPPPSLSTPTASPRTPTSASPRASTPQPQPTRAKKEKNKSGGGRLSSFFRRSWYGNTEAAEASAQAERELRANGEETLPTFGLTAQHLALDGKQQADVLSSQMNAINDKIAALLTERRNQESHADELARVDRQLRHYNNQLDVVSSELSTVNQRISSESAPPGPGPRSMPDTESPHLSRRPNVGSVRGVRQAQCQAQIDWPTEHKLQLAYSRGDIITVVEKFPTGWWKGELRGVVAYFQEKNTLPLEASSENDTASPLLQEEPTSSSSSPMDTARPSMMASRAVSSPVASTTTTPVPVQQQQQQQTATRVVAAAPVAVAAGPSQALALYSFEKQNNTEVGMSKGESVTVVKVMDAWTYVHSSQGSGYVPTSYLKLQ